MGHTGTGPHGSSNSVGWNHPDLGPMREFPVETRAYQPEMLTVPKEAVDAAIAAITIAIGYMPQVKTDVPQWQKAVEIDTIKMQCAISGLRDLSQ